MVTGKGLSGGMYPITAAMLGDRAAQWLDQDGFGHISTFGGAELGCVAAIKTLEITSRPEVRSIGALHRRPVRRRACAASRPTTPTGSSASGRTGW